MKFFSRVAPVLLGVSSLVQAATVALRNNNGQNGEFFTEFIAALEHNNLTTLADNYKKISKTEEGKPVIEFLENNKELTLLAPENCAFDQDHPYIDPDVLLYSTLWGSVDNRFQKGSHTRRGPSDSRDIANSGFQRRSAPANRKRSAPSDSKYQVIDQFFTFDSWKRWVNDRLILVDRAVGNAKVVGRFTFRGIIVLIIDTVLTLPERVSELLSKPLIKLAPNGFVKFGEALKKANLLDLVDKRDEITIFAPIDDEFCDIDKFSKDELSSFVKNHFFFGKIVFSPLFPKIGQATAESGKKLEFFFENDIHYVSCGKSRAVVLRRDVIPANGVLHVIDRPLKCD
ncbi:hypothetical protein OPQ81_009121 [Rhizoctonia solani]|nr:hypothetical protein OPQ81_009121 [Rhizoctonia solani]